jgi:hypothetical protein
MKHSLTMPMLVLSLFAGGVLAAGQASPPANGSKPTGGDGHAQHDHSDHGKMNAHAGHGAQTAGTDEFKSLDRDGDGGLSKGELAKHRLGPHFGMLDTDRNSRLSPTEFAAGKGM